MLQIGNLNKRSSANNSGLVGHSHFFGWRLFAFPLPRIQHKEDSTDQVDGENDPSQHEAKAITGRRPWRISERNIHSLVLHAVD